MLNHGRIAKSIYLDWNIFQDIIQKRKDERLIANLDAAVRKGFKIPYSHAHISDLARCGNGDYVKNDLQEIDSITKEILLSKEAAGPDFFVAKVSSFDVYEANKDAKSPSSEEPVTRIIFQPYNVEMSLLSKDNSFIPYLLRFDGLMCPALLGLLYNDIVEKGLSDYTLQRGFRNSFAEVVGLANPASKAMLDMPFYKHLLAEESEIEANFFEILESFLRIRGKEMDAIDEHEKFTTAYGILDFFPAFKEKIGRKNNINNMLTDALHVFIASKCTYFVAGDRSLLKKAELLYRTFGVKTKVYQIDDFIAKVEL